MSKEKIKSKQKQSHEPAKFKKILFMIFFSIVIFSLMLSLGFLGYEKVYAEKIFPGVKIADLEAGGQTQKELAILVNALAEKLKNQHLNIVTDDNVLTPTLSELGINFDKNKILEEAYQIGRDKPIWERFKEELQAVIFSEEITLSPEIDQDKINEYFKNNTDYIKEAKNASFKVENGKVITVLSENGSTVDVNNFSTNLLNNIQDNQINRPIILATISSKPQVSENKISKIIPQVEAIVCTPLILVYNNKSYSADSETIASWVTLETDKKGDLAVGFSDDKIKEFTSPIIQKINQKSIDKKINASTNEVIEEGRDGLEVNEENLLAQIKATLNNIGSSEEGRTLAIEVTTEEREEKKVEPEDVPQEGGTAGLYAGKYLEVNLSDQKLYAFDGTNSAGAYTVSTGKWSTPTPTGTRYIESKSDRAYSSKYDLYMPFWNSIGGGYGIHELPEWASGYKEGTSHLGTPVSHGCIRLGIGSAEFIYNWAPIGTPVYIHN